MHSLSKKMKILNKILRKYNNFKSNKTFTVIPTAVEVWGVLS